jgi:hypothetical protein
MLPTLIQDQSEQFNVISEKDKYYPIVQVYLNKFMINSLNTATTTLDNIASVFFNPNDITMYRKLPHFSMNLVLCLSSCANSYLMVS